MIDLPKPLTPPECDLRDFQFMPLEVGRLRRSKAWLLCKRDPAVAFYMINLWSASWHEVPAASLEDDDDVLADLAMCDPRKWDKIKAVVMRGWVKCSDGRLYHKVVAEKANTSWTAKLAQRQRTQAARDSRSQKRSQDEKADPTSSVTDSVTETVTTSVTENVTSSVTDNVTESVTGSKGEYKGESSKKDSDLRSDAIASNIPDSRVVLWSEGLEKLHRMTGKPPRALRTVIGKWAKEVRDDCAMLNAIIDDCVEVRPGEPIAWISAGITARMKPPDKHAWDIFDDEPEAAPPFDLEMTRDVDGTYRPH